MFRITAVGAPSWFGVEVVVVAESAMEHEERRLRFSGRKVAVVENWRIAIEEGEKFVIRLDKSDMPEAGDQLPLAKVMKEWPLRRKWRKTVIF